MAIIDLAMSLIWASKVQRSVLTTPQCMALIIEIKDYSQMQLAEDERVEVAFRQENY